MSRRKLAALGVPLFGAPLAAALFIFLSPLGSASTPEPPSAVHLPPDPPPSRPATGRPQDATPTATTPRDTDTVVLEDAAPPTHGCGPAERLRFGKAQVLSYYGNPYIAEMGILGELPPDQLVERLTAHARLYDSLNGRRGIQPALHLVYATAQSEPYDGLHLLYVDDETLDEYIRLACENGLLIFLDLQIGRSDAPTEVGKILPYLEQPHVHVALDPEFAMPPGEVPGETIGSLDAADINAAQAILEGLITERDLPDKLLVVHQFTHGMVTRPELLQDYARVKLVIDMDGFGPAEIKRVKYGWFAAPAEHSGIKLFFRQDTDLMSEEDVLALDPDVIIYQ